MPQWHGDQKKRKKTGGRKRVHRRKRSYEIGSAAAQTAVGETKRKRSIVCGGNMKLRLLSCNIANVTDPSTNVTKKVEITNVVRNPSNVDYERRGIITKGAIIATPLGEAHVTSRPGQDGVVNAILMKTR
ncbi:MAG: 30S ribosomal protein S8e [Candidatus Bathyarchaeota archaeon]|nr:30S ribosomal protein S8e [Candidatus Bathyarchaeota archaeon]